MNADAEDAVEYDEIDDPRDELANPDDIGSMLIRPRLSLQSRPMPAVRVLPQTREQPEQPLLSGASDAGAAPSTQKKKRLAGRNTRVELQAIPRQEKKPSRKTKPLADSVEKSPGQQVKEIETEKPLTVRAYQSHAAPRENLSGKAKFLTGSAEAMVHNSHVTLSSVVLVTLLSNPGQVVVQYFTLLPGYGFTVHLSSSVIAETAFNYVILPGEFL